MQKLLVLWGSSQGVAPALVALLLSLVTIQSAHPADRVGVAAAVTPQATSQPPGPPTSTLKIGKEIVYNERIDTSDSGVVQVLLLDGSTFTVGPQSSLVIDNFVYDPKRGKGALVATFSKGALRFVGGKLSKDEHGITVKTPAGMLTVRGGIFQGVVSGPNRALFAFIFGDHLSLKRGGRLDTIRPGNLFAVSGPGRAVERTTTAADINFILAAVSGHRTKLAGKTIPVKGQRLALLLWNPALRPLSGSALHQGALLQRGHRRHRPLRAEARARPSDRHAASDGRARACAPPASPSAPAAPAGDSSDRAAYDHLPKLHPPLRPMRRKCRHQPHHGAPIGVWHRQPRPLSAPRRPPILPVPSGDPFIALHRLCASSFSGSWTDAKMDRIGS